MNDLVLSSSMLGNYCICARKYYYRAVLGLASTRESFPLRVGSKYHHFMDQLSKGNDYEVDPNDEAAETANFMVERYLDRWGDRAFFGDTKLDSEYEFELDYFDDCKFVGKCDGILYRDDGLFLLERKTTSRIDLDYISRAQISQQISLYSLCMSEILGEKIQGVIFDVAGRPRKYRRKGESIQSYLDRCTAKYIKSPNTYFHRQIVFHSERDFNEFENDLRALIDTIYDYMDRDHWPKQTPWCFDRFKPCEYTDFCIHGINERTLLDFVRRDPFCELDSFSQLEEQ